MEVWHLLNCRAADMVPSDVCGIARSHQCVHASNICIDHLCSSAGCIFTEDTPHQGVILGSCWDLHTSCKPMCCNPAGQSGHASILFDLFRSCKRVFVSVATNMIQERCKWLHGNVECIPYWRYKLTDKIRGSTGQDLFT